MFDLKLVPIAMKTCICHDISDRTVRAVLADFFKGIIVHTKRRGDAAHETQEPNNLDDLHEACSGGAGFNCGTCACAMAEIATEHNHNVRIAELKENMPAPVVPSPAPAITAGTSSARHRKAEPVE